MIQQQGLRVTLSLCLTEPFKCHARVSYTTRGSVCHSPQSTQETQRRIARDVLNQVMRLHDKQRRRLAASQMERAERAFGSGAAAAASATTAAPAAAAERPVEYTFPYAVEQVVEQA